MISNQTDKVVIYVAPWFSDVSERALRFAVRMPGVRVVLITKERDSELSGFIKRRLAGYHRTKEVFESRELLRLAKKVACEMGSISTVFGDAEEIQVPVAKVRDSLGIPGMKHREALNFRDKFLMKSVLSQHGIKCAQHQIVQNMAEARRASKHFGFPLVIKPRSGARCANTYLVNNASALETKLEVVLDKHNGEAYLRSMFRERNTPVRRCR